MTCVRSKFVEHGPGIDLSEWGFGFGGKLDEEVAENVAEIIRQELSEHPPEIRFPFEWGDSDGIGGPAVDPLTVYIELPFTNDWAAPCTWSLSLAEVVDDLIDLHTGVEKIEDTNGAKVARQLAAAFRTLADKLEASIDEEQIAKLTHSGTPE